jgi:hypothetical protein
MKNGELTSIFDPKFSSTTVPNLRASSLALTHRARPDELRRKFPPGLFHPLLHDVLKFDHGEATVHRDSVTGAEVYRYWTISQEELVWRWTDITKHRISTERHCRTKALAYYEAMSTMGLLFLEKQEDGRYQVQFPDMTQWMAQAMWELEAEGRLIERDLVKLNRLHWFGNGISWDMLLPNKRRVRIHDRGLILKIRSVAVCARTWANHANRIVTLVTDGILNGACDYHPYSERPKIRKSIRDDRRGLRDPSISQIEKAKEELKGEALDKAEQGEPTFRSWTCCVAEMARFNGHSVTTHKRRRSLGSEWLINIERQALVVGEEVDYKVMARLRDVRERWGAQPYRFYPTRPGYWQPQLDVPSRIRWKKKYLNWPMYHAIPPELYCRPEGRKDGTPPKECVEILVPMVTQHKAQYRAQFGKTQYVVLSPSVVRLAYLGDEGSPEMQRELKRAGLKTWKGPFRRKIRVAARGTHHKDRTKFKKKAQADGTWRGVFPMDLLDVTEADKNRRVHPRTLKNRRYKEEDYYYDEATRASLRSYFQGRIANGPHRGLDQDQGDHLQGTGPPSST